MPWPDFRTKKPAQTSEQQDDDDEEFMPNTSSPFLRGLSNARYALCGPRAACSCTTITFVTMIINVTVFVFCFFFTAIPTAKTPEAAASSALLGPSQCQLAGGGGLWPPALRYHFNVHQLFTCIFLHASFIHLVVSLCTIMRYGLSFEHRRSISELILLIVGSGVIGGLVSAATVPATVLVCGSMPAFALMGDELANVLWAGGCTMFDGTGNRRKRRLPYRLLVVTSFGAANIGCLLFSNGSISILGCLVSTLFGALAAASEYPSRKSRNASIDHGEGTGDQWAWWKRSGYLVGIVSICFLFAIAVLGFEGASSIVDGPAPIC
jgi:membrane associated rhomboid family serine protease